MQRPYRTIPESRKLVAEEVQRFLAKGVIEPAQSEWAAPVTEAPETDGSLRFCVDYRKPNDMIIRDT